MGDRCYMSVHCRREDKSRFEELGFVLEFDEDKHSPVIEMVDEEANYGHCDKMPANIPYYGAYGSGANYGPGSVVCDGEEYEDVPASSDGFVVAWNYRWGLPKLKSILRVRRYLKIKRRAEKVLRELHADHLLSITL